MVAHYLLTLSIFACVPYLATALRLAKSMQSNMVLQRAPHRAVIYGFADAEANITVVTDDGNQWGHSVADRSGRFSVELVPQQAGGPHTLFVNDMDSKERVTLKGILFGDVWICSGQSNMQFAVSSAFNSSAEIADAVNYPDIRLMNVQLNESTVELHDFSDLLLPWSSASPESVGGPEWTHFSAVCYFFGRELYKHLKVPIGLVSSNYGGTPIVAWSDAAAVAECGPPSVLDASSLSSALADRPTGLESQTSQDPSVLFNAMISPLLPMTIKGAIWYQGEADIGRPEYYECAFPVMIESWRKRFVHSKAEGDFPFGFVQLSSYDSGSLGSVDTDVGRMRIAQYAGFQAPNVFFAPSFDLGDKDGGIHPRDKQDVAHRLAASCLRLVYGDMKQASGPYVRSIAASQNRRNTIAMKVQFGNVWDQLVYADIQLMFEITDPSSPDSAYATAASRVEVVDKDLMELEFDYDGPAHAVLLRYGYRNNVCPSQEVPYYAGATCGLYAQSGEDPPQRVFPQAPFVKVIKIGSTWGPLAEDV